jgi:hypothetical protein
MPALKMRPPALRRAVAGIRAVGREVPVALGADSFEGRLAGHQIPRSCLTKTYHLETAGDSQ